MAMREPMPLRRVHTDTGSYNIDPPLNPEWGGLDQLRWKAGVVTHDTGLDIRVGPGRTVVSGREVPDCYSIQIGRSATVLTRDEAWTYLSGVHAGIEPLTRQVAEQTHDPAGERPTWREVALWCAGYRTASGSRPPHPDREQP